MRAAEVSMLTLAPLVRACHTDLRIAAVWRTAEKARAYVAIRLRIDQTGFFTDPPPR